MSEYISKTEAINKIMGNIVHQDSHDANLHNIGLRKAMSALDSFPAADVVEVVRCRDCKHRLDDDFCSGRGWPMGQVPDDGYCDRAKRKDGGQGDV